MAIVRTKGGNLRRGRDGGLDVLSEIEWRSHVRSLRTAVDDTSKETWEYMAHAIAERAAERVKRRSGLLARSIEGKARKIYGGKPGEYTATISTKTQGKMQPGYWEERRGVGFRQTDPGDPWKWRYRRPSLVTYGYGADVEVGRANYSSTPYIRPAVAQIARTVPAVMAGKAAYFAAKQQARKRQTEIRRVYRADARAGLRNDQTPGLDPGRFLNLGDDI